MKANKLKLNPEVFLITKNAGLETQIHTTLGKVVLLLKMKANYLEVLNLALTLVVLVTVVAICAFFTQLRLLHKLHMFLNTAALAIVTYGAAATFLQCTLDGAAFGMGTRNFIWFGMSPLGC